MDDQAVQDFLIKQDHVMEDLDLERQFVLMAIEKHGPLPELEWEIQRIAATESRIEADVNKTLEMLLDQGRSRSVVPRIRTRKTASLTPPPRAREVGEHKERA